MSLVFFRTEAEVVVVVVVVVVVEDGGVDEACFEVARGFDFSFFEALRSTEAKSSSSTSESL